ncbi:MAG: hypothetical protein LBH73_09300 [Spirochaetaceae bacterium]|nr:hypothetical protein [Spirochaetaceae bacterium]
MNKKRLVLGLVLCSAPFLFSDGWYISNAAGMALEPALSVRALRAGYALQVSTAQIWRLPPRLAEALRSGRIPAGVLVEEHFLYEKGELVSTRWILKDGVVRAAASFRDDGSGYMDIYDEQGTLIEERSYDSDDVTIIAVYSYRSGRLQKAEVSRIRPEESVPETLLDDVGIDSDTGGILDSEGTHNSETVSDIEQALDANGNSDTENGSDTNAASPPVDQIAETTSEAAGSPDTEGPSEPRRYVEEALWTDLYRYNRASALRSIERRYPPGADGEERQSETAAFPRLPGRHQIARLVSPYSAFSSEFLRDIMGIGASVEFTTDERGRILTETRRDEDGEILGTLSHIWTGDRLSSVSWETEDEKRRVEFEYNSDGDRTAEKNYRNDVLERSVTSEGNRDIEDLYLDGVPVLRAVWEDGRKISEELIGRKQSGPPNPRNSEEQGEI